MRKEGITLVAFQICQADVQVWQDRFSKDKAKFFSANRLCIRKDRTRATGQAGTVHTRWTVLLPRRGVWVRFLRNHAGTKEPTNRLSPLDYAFYEAHAPTLASSRPLILAMPGLKSLRTHVCILSVAARFGCEFRVRLILICKVTTCLVPIVLPSRSRLSKHGGARACPAGYTA